MNDTGPDHDVLSVVVPAFNEGEGVAAVLEALKSSLARLPCAWEMIVVDDASTDDTGRRVAGVEGVRLVRNPVNLGYGHSLLRGISAARGTLIAISDADGTYPAGSIPGLYEAIQEGADHVIGHRTGRHFGRAWLTRPIYRWLCGYVVGAHVPDANSGLRIFRRDLVERLRRDLCLGFSFTTSLTLASLLTGYIVVFRTIPYEKRTGHSHVRFRDVLRTAQYLFQLIAAYNPIKLYLPMVAFAGLAAAASLLLAALGMWNAGALAGVVMTATALLLAGIGTHAYIVSRTGLRLTPVRQGLEPPHPPADGD